ncbi:MAG: beta-propeller fold lactonase family protein [Bdellovibrionota bacterium]
MNYKPQAAILTIAVIFFVVCFQNCGSFTAKPYAGLQASNSPDSRPTPSPTPPAEIAKSYFFVGGVGAIKGFEIDHATDAVTSVADVSLPGQTPGWLSIDVESQSLIATDSSGPRLSILSFDTMTGALNPVRTLGSAARSDHHSLYRSGSSLFVYNSDYNGGKMTSIEVVGAAMDVAAITQTFTYSAGAHTHSSAIDPVRNLVFVANLDAEKIVVYSNVAGTLSFQTEVAVADPRMLVYDTNFDRLFVTTESYTGSSAVKIFSISGSGAGLAIVEVGSFDLQGQRGAALKIDRSNRYAVATVREAGVEKIWSIPLTANGLIDPSRVAVSMPSVCKEARSLEISADGKYYVLVCNHATNLVDVVVRKITYGTDSSITSFDVIREIDTGSGTFPSSALFSVEK